MRDVLIVCGAWNRLDVIAHQCAQAQQAEWALRRFKRNKIGIGIHARYRSGSRLRGNKAYALLCPLLVLGRPLITRDWCATMRQESHAVQFANSLFFCDRILALSPRARSGAAEHHRPAFKTSGGDGMSHCLFGCGTTFTFLLVARGAVPSGRTPIFS